MTKAGHYVLPMSNLELIPTAEVAAMAGRDVRTVNRWVLTGKLKPAVQTPGTRGARMFHVADVEALLKAERDQKSA